MAFQYSTLPLFVQELSFSDEFFDALLMLRATYTPTPEHEQKLDELIDDLFARTLQPNDLERVIGERFGFNAQTSRAFAKDIILHVMLTIPGFFGDQTELYRSLGGDPENDLAISPVVRGIMRRVNAVLEEKLAKLNEVDLDKESEWMRDLFAAHLTDHFFAPDADYKIRLNDTILALLMTHDAYHEKLLNALYENKEEIGPREITLPDGTTQAPTVAHWIQDYLGFSGGTVSSITVAQYLSQNSNVNALNERDEDVVRRLLETFSVLKNFPESLDSIPQDQWKIIPYYHTTEATKIPQTAKAEEAIIMAPKPQIVIVPPPVAITPLSAEQKSIDFFTLADAVISKAGIILSDDMRDRVRKVIETRLRNVRNDVDTRERLLASVGEGGAGLGIEEIEKLMKEVGTALKAIAENTIAIYVPPPVIPSPKEEESHGSPEQRDSSALQTLPAMVIKEVDGVPTLVEKVEKKGNGKKKTEGKRVSALSLDPGQGLPRVPPRSQDDPEGKPLASYGASKDGHRDDISVPAHLQDAQTIPVTVTPQALGSLTKDTQALGAEKKPIPDVKASPRLVTVIDELRALTIKDIRRISQDTKTACQKILDKINALSKESLSKRAEAINAWKESPAYALYLEIGQLNIGQDMTKLADERKAASKDYLTSEEFDALLGLNEQLRF